MRRDVWLILGSVAMFGAVTAALAAGGTWLEPDLVVRSWSEAHRSPSADLVARGLNRLGQGGALLTISVVLAGWLAWRTRAVWPLLYVAAAVVLLVPTVRVLKDVTERGAPSSPLPPEETVPLLGPLPPGEYAAGYPSGHVVNTVVWYGVLLLLVTALLHAYGRGGLPAPVRTAIRTAPVVIVVGTSTYLSFHWLTDGLAGLALGVAIDRTLHLVRWPA